MIDLNTIYQGDALAVLQTFPDNLVDCCITSPPYWSLRDYKVECQIGMEEDFNEYILKLRTIFQEVKRVLKPTGTCWIVIGDTYYTKSGSGFVGQESYGSKESVEKYGLDKMNRLRSGKLLPQKSLVCIPDRLRLGLMEDGWIIRNKIVWWKENRYPFSGKDRFTVDQEDIVVAEEDIAEIEVDYDELIVIAKNRKYFFNQLYQPFKWGISTTRKAINERTMVNYGDNPKGKHLGTIWQTKVGSESTDHIATFPIELVDKMMTAGCPKTVCSICSKPFCECPLDTPRKKGVVLDPFMGSGTVGVVAVQKGADYIGIDLKPEYVGVAKKRIVRERERQDNLARQNNLIGDET